MKEAKKSDIDEFSALPASEKERIFAELDAETPEQSLARSRPLNAKRHHISRAQLIAQGLKAILGSAA